MGSLNLSPVVFLKPRLYVGTGWTVANHLSDIFKRLRKNFLFDPMIHSSYTGVTMIHDVTHENVVKDQVD